MLLGGGEPKVARESSGPSSARLPLIWGDNHRFPGLEAPTAGVAARCPLEPLESLGSRRPPQDEAGPREAGLHASRLPQCCGWKFHRSPLPGNVERGTGREGLGGGLWLTALPTCSATQRSEVTVLFCYLSIHTMLGSTTGFDVPARCFSPLRWCYMHHQHFQCHCKNISPIQWGTTRTKKKKTAGGKYASAHFCGLLRIFALAKHANLRLFADFCGFFPHLSGSLAHFSGVFPCAFPLWNFLRIFFCDVEKNVSVFLLPGKMCVYFFSHGKMCLFFF